VCVDEIVPRRRRELDLQTRIEDTDRDLCEDKDMSKVADGIHRGLQQAVAYAKGEADRSAYRVHVPPPPRGQAPPGSTCARSARVSA